MRGSATLLVLALAAHAAAQDDPYSLMKKADETLVARDEAAVRGKYAVMSQDPFSFFRGNAPVFYRGLERSLLRDFTSPSSDVWLGGDAHLGNFGVVRRGDGSLGFTLNDFDEAFRGPYVFDLQRLATSIVLAGRAAKIDKKRALDAVDAAARSYLETLDEVKKGKLGPGWIWTRDDARGAVRDALDTARKASRRDLIAKLSKNDRFILSSDLVAPEAADRSAVEASVAAYLESVAREHRPSSLDALSVAKKLGSGVGSRGLARFWVLVRRADGERHILEWKEERRASGGPVAANEALRVVTAERALLDSPEPLLGWTTVAGRPFLVRERSPHELAPDLTALDAKDLLKLGADVARSLAYAHAFSLRGETPPEEKARAIREAARSKDRLAAALSAFAENDARDTRHQFEDFRASFAADRGFSRGPSATSGIGPLIDRAADAGRDR